MKVLHVIPSVSPVRGGPSRAVLDMVFHLIQHGIDTEIVTTNDDGDRVLGVPFNHLVASGDVPELLGPSVPIRFFPRYSPEIPSIREFALSGPLSSWLWKNLSQYDLIHVHALFSYPSTAAMAIARFQNVPYIIRPLGQLCEWSLQQQALKKQLYLRAIERANLRGSRALHFTSVLELQEAAVQGFNMPNFVLPHGVTMPTPIPHVRQVLRRRLQLPDQEKIVLFLSRLHPKKGLENLLQAWYQLPIDLGTLVIAGSGDASYEAAITQQINALGLASRVRQVGFVQGEEKDCLLQGADLFVLPSYSENFGIAVLEAMAAGLPVMIAPGVAIAGIVQDHNLGWVAEPTPAAIAQTITHAFSNPIRTHLIGLRASAYVQQHYSWDAQVQSLIEHYHHLLTPYSEPITLPASQVG